MNSEKIKCNVCMHACSLGPGQSGLCGARANRDGVIVSTNYGLVTSLALDPIEKKPLYMFHPGSYILSTGSYGCNLKCPFCQNYEISQATDDDMAFLGVRRTTPEQLAQIVLSEPDSIGLAYTYNEPLISYEFVRDTSRLIHEGGKFNVLVTNGEANPEILDELLPYIDAMNIDLKGFTDEIYKRLGGDLSLVMSTIEKASKTCHVELTSLIVPGINDSLTEMEREAIWIASLNKDIPLHITRCFPRYKMPDIAPTDISLMRKMKAVAEKHLSHVFLGNI
ncbi:MAG: AmmeMemoRadiSam system radical SAM enzyme [Lachnospiraceae bacterium]|nr:AmmeMemoRadiSam system radical SAM enzyme [Lachnospiraceae bacterium]